MTKKQTNTASRNMLKELTFCVFDLETTGGNHNRDQIIEIGLVKIEKLKIVAEKQFLVRPDVSIPEFIQRLTSIHPEDVENAPSIEDVIDEILEFMGDSVLVAHNASFDIPFFNSVLKRLNKPKLENKSMCTVLMTKYLIPNLMNSNLNYMSKIFGIRHKKAHRALDDAKAAANLLLKYLKLFIDKKISKINHLYYPRNKYEIDRINIKKDNREELEQTLENLLCPYLITVKGENGVILFSLPCGNKETEKEFILKNVKDMDFESVTIRLFGSFLESWLYYTVFASKLDENVQKNILTFLRKEHLQDKKSTLKCTDDFVIIQHLVPDQYIVYPIMAIGKNSGLLFRYPDHHKKLLQFLNSRSSKITNNKLKFTRQHPDHKAFITQYLMESNKNQTEKLFLFSKDLLKDSSTAFVSTMKNFIKNNPNKYNFPKKYI